ncbi:MAG: DNA methyltransferase [Candidatus Bathyarchaeia archaeon]
MAKLFFLVSGEFESLSFSELQAILQAEGYAYSVTDKLDQILRLTADGECVVQVHRRSAYTRVCAEELFVCDANEPAITEAVASANFQSVLCEGETFEVRIRRIKEYATKEATMHHERLLGKLILQNAPKAKVYLKKPQKSFFGVLTSGKLVFGIKLAEIIPKPFVERRARKKPFFHPSAMNAKLARCMVNLAQPKSGGFVLDPFCGTGSTVIEATLIGCRAVGIDVQPRMAKGALRNVRHFGLEPEGMIVADARKLPLARLDCIVTDPPYGKSATTLKSGTRAMVEGIFSSASALLAGGQRICIAAPKTLDIRRIGETYGFRHLESHFAYVHRSLTREVAVFEKR